MWKGYAMAAKWILAIAGLMVTASVVSAADEERKIDPTFLHRNTASAREAPSDITATGCHYKPLFGEGDADANSASGIARFAVVVVDPGASCKSASYAGEDQIYVVLNGAGTAAYGSEQVSLGKEDFLYLPASVPHALRNSSAAAFTVAIMGYRIAGF